MSKIKLVNERDGIANVNMSKLQELWYLIDEIPTVPDYDEKTMLKILLKTKLKMRKVIDSMIILRLNNGVDDEGNVIAYEEDKELIDETEFKSDDDSFKSDDDSFKSDDLSWDDDFVEDDFSWEDNNIQD